MLPSAVAHGPRLVGGCRLAELGRSTAALFCMDRPSIPGQLRSSSFPVWPIQHWSVVAVAPSSPASRYKRSSSRGLVRTCGGGKEDQRSWPGLGAAMRPMMRGLDLTGVRGPEKGGLGGPKRAPKRPVLGGRKGVEIGGFPGGPGGAPGGQKRPFFPVFPKMPKNGPPSHSFLAKSVPTGRVIKYPRKCTPPGSPGAPPGDPRKPPFLGPLRDPHFGALLDPPKPAFLDPRDPPFGGPPGWVPCPAAWFRDPSGPRGGSGLRDHPEDLRSGDTPRVSGLSPRASYNSDWPMSHRGGSPAKTCAFARSPVWQSAARR